MVYPNFQHPEKIHRKLFTHLDKTKRYNFALAKSKIYLQPKLGTTCWPIRLSVRTRDFHSLKSSSILLWATYKKI